MPFHQIPTNAQDNFLPLCDCTRRQPSKVAQVRWCEEGIGVILGDEQTRKNVPRFGRFIRECANCLSGTNWTERFVMR